MAGNNPFIPCKQCPDQCEPVFDRVVVSRLIAGGTKVMWELLPTFTDPGPLLFQLQVGTTANPNADDWTDVGGLVENVYFAIDPEQRVFGKTNWTYYRVKVYSGLGVYVSMPTGAGGTLSQTDWLKAKNLVRRKLTTFRMGEGQEGYLLKRRVTGQRCRVCLDYITEEVRQPDCPSCYGTGFECGYYYPMSCTWANISPRSRHIHIDGEMRATINDIVVQGQMLMIDLLVEEDVYVNKVTDDRYYVHKIDHTVEIRGVPVLANVELRPIPFSSTIYEIAIPEQLAALGLGV
jgi:hypothetical protein